MKKILPEMQKGLGLPFSVVVPALHDTVETFFLLYIIVRAFLMFIISQGHLTVTPNCILPVQTDHWSYPRPFLLVKGWQHQISDTLVGHSKLYSICLTTLHTRNVLACTLNHGLCLQSLIHLISPTCSSCSSFSFPPPPISPPFPPPPPPPPLPHTQKSTKE